MGRIVVLACLVALAVPASGGAAGGRDVRAIRGLLQQQLRLLKHGKFRQSYTLTTPSFRSHCPYPRFLRQAREARRRLGPSAQLDRVRVDFKTRRRALVEYRVLKNGKLFMWVRFSRGDRYAKLGTRWYDDYDQLKC
ncbi:MAG TPA: hypothetical protein VHI55_13025 [Gaiellaceae bacterium]|nr:hypothetical protein [Gaiellaceae bacterium]